MITSELQGPSELRGVIEKLQKGKRLSSAAVEEIDRLLGLLKSEGWGGGITADCALRAILARDDDFSNHVPS